MSSFNPFSFWPIKFGLTFLFLALFLSVIGLHKVPITYEQSGKLGPGYHLLGNDSFENNYLYANRTLQLSSSNASLEIYWGSQEYPLNLTTSVTLKPAGRPAVRVISGEVSYRYKASSWRYPYAFLAIPALFSVMIGSVLVFVGYIKFKQGGA
ncbi:hypothetical protein [Thermococcus sp.]|uniref:hypothetical protein n=1 Tax=Thermococcus sp. TaxID=35749 RepID=UPI002610F58B|nr:hypothetical protein [Thermococcus sp.]